MRIVDRPPTGERVLHDCFGKGDRPAQGNVYPQLVDLTDEIGDGAIDDAQREFGQRRSVIGPLDDAAGRVECLRR